MPFPGTRVVPEGWSRHHQPVASGGMNAACVITDPARTTPGGWNDDTGQYDSPTPFVVVAETRCRVQAIQSDQGTEQVGQDSTIREYLVQLDDTNLSTLPDIEVGHVVDITAVANDPHLVGQLLTIRDVQHGSERFTRDLVAVHNQQPSTT